jgi:predicted dehydrogenase
MNRRQFISSTAMGSAAIASSFYIPASADDKKLKIALIGTGWYGMVIAKAALKEGNVEFTGICDVDADHLTKSADELEKLQGKRPKTYKDYQELLDMKGIDVVFIASPPQWHALQFIAACKKGYDIYCEKPLAYDVKEGMAMIEAAKKAGNIVQIGFQRRQSEAFKRTRALIESGDAGKILQIGAQIHYNPNVADTSVQSPPPSLDWDAWCGPAPKLDYRPSIGHFQWRLEKEFGNGHLVDWGIHHIDTIRMIMGDQMPESFQTSGGIMHLKDKITTPDTLIAHMAFPKAPVVWQHRMWGTGSMDPSTNNGIFFYGEKATIFASDSKMVVMPTGKNQESQEFSIPTPGMQERHVGEFLAAVRNKNASALSSTVEDAFQSSASVQMAMIAYQTKSIVRWDAEKKLVINNPEATKLLKREYRGKWKHPG